MPGFVRKFPTIFERSAAVAAAAAAAEAIGVGLTACGRGALTTTATSPWKGQREAIGAGATATGTAVIGTDRKKLRFDPTCINMLWACVSKRGLGKPPPSSMRRPTRASS
jgi:hypothetical protein